MHDDRLGTPPLPRSPSGRVPRWVLDEALGRPVPAEPWRSWSPGSAPARRRRRRGRRVLPMVVVLALAGTATYLQGAGMLPWPSVVGGASALGAPAASADRPSAGREETSAPLGRPEPTPTSSGPHAFVATQADGVEPVTYDPCRPVHYGIRPDQAPPGGEAVVHDAVARVSRATGLLFVYDGPVEENAAADRAPYQPARYGDRWAPVVISWETVVEDPTLAGDVAGLGGSTWVEVPGGPRSFVTGQISLDAEWMAGVLSDPTTAPAARSVVLHELGHLVGLAHVPDPAQLMNPVGGTGVVDYAAGDLAGLARLGQGACVPGL